MLKDRNIVLKRVGNRLFLPAKEVLDHEAPPGLPRKPFLMCRTKAFNESTGTLELLLLPDVVSEGHYHIAVEVNSNAFLSSEVKALIFVGFPQASISNSAPIQSPMNGYIQDSSDPSGEDDPYEEKVRELKKSYEAQLLREKEKPTQEPKETKIVDVNIELPVNDLKFENGKVSFEYYIYLLNRKVRLDIINSYIKKEYDAIKNYFSNVLNTKKFTISIHVEIIDRRILNYSATSPQVAKINESLFELVEDAYIEDTFINNVEDEIYTLKERAYDVSKQIGSEKILDPNWLLDKLITKERTKHYFHLRYLSSKHLSDMFHLHMTGRSISFIFLIPNQKNYLLVWETYSTEEATYVWQLDDITSSKLTSTVEDLVEKIMWLRMSNKIAYLKTKPENFKRIEHDYVGEDMGFKKWKGQLDDFISK